MRILARIANVCIMFGKIPLYGWKFTKWNYCSRLNISVNWYIVYLFRHLGGASHGSAVGPSLQETWEEGRPPIPFQRHILLLLLRGAAGQKAPGLFCPPDAYDELNELSNIPTKAFEQPKSSTWLGNSPQQILCDWYVHNSRKRLSYVSPFHHHSLPSPFPSPLPAFISSSPWVSNRAPNVIPCATTRIFYNMDETGLKSASFTAVARAERSPRATRSTSLELWSTRPGTNLNPLLLFKRSINGSASSVCFRGSTASYVSSCNDNTRRNG